MNIEKWVKLWTAPNDPISWCCELKKEKQKKTQDPIGSYDNCQ